MRKLRVSLTDACNYYCFYCKPSRVAFTPKGQLLDAWEYRRICGALIDAGIQELRLTGGEPTVRPEYPSILDALADLPAQRKGVTSNGHLLARHLSTMLASGWTHVNVSMDSLDPGRFSAITGGGDFRTVMDAIERAAAMGFAVKINTVIMRGINDGELEDFALWSARTGIPVRFLEYMRIGPDLRLHFQRFVSAEEMHSRLGRLFRLNPAPSAADSTAELFTTDSGADLGFIASETRPFCASCSRLRLSATGVLRACVMGPGGRSIRHAGPEEIAGLAAEVMGMKPLRHPESNPMPMHILGG